MKWVLLTVLAASFVWLGAFAMNDAFRAWMLRQTWRSLFSRNKRH